MKRWLILEDGTHFVGEGFGATNSVVGELVFTTSMTGYQETITDQSFNGQIITFTYPMVGNYGVNRDDYESIAPTCKGVVVKEHARRGSNWRNQMTLDEFLSKVKLQLNVSHLKVINEGAKTSIKNVAVCAGSGAEFIEPLGRYNIDAYVTADVKYHQALEPARFVVIDVGHFESEKPFVERITNMLRKAKGDKVEVVIANEKPAWNIV